MNIHAGPYIVATSLLRFCVCVCVCVCVCIHTWVLDTTPDANKHMNIHAGPYICAEWDAGGLPAWLLGIDGLKIRT